MSPVFERLFQDKWPLASVFFHCWSPSRSLSKEQGLPGLCRKKRTRLKSGKINEWKRELWEEDVEGGLGVQLFQPRDLTEAVTVLITKENAQEEFPFNFFFPVYF